MQDSTKSKREEIVHNGDKRYIRRDDHGRIKSSVEKRASLSADARPKARTTLRQARVTAAIVTPNKAVR